MKLSEAMREGAKLRPQGFGAYFTYQGRSSDGTREICSCAVGAAIEGATGKVGKPDNINSWKDDPEIREVLYNWGLYPDVEKQSIYSQLQRDIVNLNDGRGRSREQIADWLESKGY